MPTVNFGEKKHFDGGGATFFKLESKNQKVTVRFLAPAQYDGKHFMKDGDNWNISYCPRIMNEKECKFCEEYFHAKADMKQIEVDYGKKDTLTGDIKKAYKVLEEKARKFKVSQSFYYPALDRGTEEAVIFKVTQSIRWKLDEEFDNGIPVLDFDYIVKRTEKPGSDYYTLTRVDSSMVKPFTDKEEKEIDKALGWDMEKKVFGNASSQNFEQKEKTETKDDQSLIDEDVSFEDILKGIEEENGETKTK